MPSRAYTLAARAHSLRSSLTPSEQRLWAALRASKLGVPFRRQVVLLNRFIADFYAPSARLVVEVDGGYHTERRAADARRDQKLRRAGYQVLRLPAELVMRELPAALAAVAAALGR